MGMFLTDNKFERIFEESASSYSGYVDPGKALEIARLNIIHWMGDLKVLKRLIQNYENLLTPMLYKDRYFYVEKNNIFETYANKKNELQSQHNVILQEEKIAELNVWILDMWFQLLEIYRQKKGMGYKEEVNDVL